MKSHPGSSSRSQSAGKARARKRCAAIVAVLSAYLDDEVDDRTRARVESHLPRCARCARAMATLAVVADATSRVRGRGPTRAFELGFRRFAAVVARIAKRGAGDTEPARDRVRLSPSPARHSAGTRSARRRGSRST
ncbi:MAG: zf-HC2 domain-containing protein [Planctomycetes bacterium]|nr:zf-HC2 domain-containing protein [Planctomycetota bacterium]MCC7169288.1 zf-HC2 domain-containing protein [Planctomycetota bacterium]